jgi:hypothetical protein
MRLTLHRAVRSTGPITISSRSLYPGIGTATVDSANVIAENAMVVKSFGTIPTLANVISQAGRPPDLTNSAILSGSGTSSGKAATITPKPAQGGNPKPATGGALSVIAQRIYKAMGPGSPTLTYREIMHRSGMFVDDVIVGLAELNAKGKAVLVTSHLGLEVSWQRAYRL